MKITNGVVRGALAVALAGALTLGNTGKTYETGCETYQGYTNISDGERIYVFDPLTIYERNDSPERAVFGSPSLKMKIGEQYRLKIKDPVLGQERIVSAEHCE